MELALIALLAVQGGRLVWLFLEPDAPAAVAANAAVTPVDKAIFQRFDAFFRTDGPGPLDDRSGPDAEGLVLYGVRTGGQDGGSAIIGLPDGRQVSVAVGETVLDDLILESVGEDHVIVARGLAVSRIQFSEIPADAPPPPPPPAADEIMGPAPVSAAVPAAPASASAATVGPVVDPQRLMAQAALRPRMDGLRIRGFTLSARGDGAALRTAGLQSGDVILAVNGAELSSLERLSELGGELSAAASAEIRFERNGRVQTTTIRTGQ